MLILVVVLTCLMILVMITDLLHYIIPNWLVILLLALYPVMLFLSPARPVWWIGLLLGLGAFFIGFALFAFKIMGGGDVKLLAVLSIWVGLSALPEFVMEVAIFGGVLSLFLLTARPFTAFILSKVKHPPAIPRVLTVGEPVPYGIAIALAFLITLWGGDIPGVKM